MIHLKNTGFQPTDASMLLTQVKELVTGFDGEVRDARVSKQYLEFDVSVNKQSLDPLLQKLKSIGGLEDARHIVEETMEKTKALEMAQHYFNNERFWECHEVLEGVWKKLLGNEKRLVQGIILVAAAFVHYQKNENAVCLSILNRALEKLDGSGEYYGINIDEFKKKVTSMVREQNIETFSI